MAIYRRKRRRANALLWVEFEFFGAGKEVKGTIALAGRTSLLAWSNA